MNVIMWLDDVLYTVAPDGVTRQAIIRVRCACRT
jgi:branched-subunit amino acid aminotransferase/4-amino-4-deoxychorismate lyase